MTAVAVVSVGSGEPGEEHWSHPRVECSVPWCIVQTRKAGAMAAHHSGATITDGKRECSAMAIDAIQVWVEGSSGEECRFRLTTLGPDGELEEPFGYVVSEEDLDDLVEMRNHFELEEVVCGNSASQKSRGLVSRQSVPFLAVSYSSRGRFEQGFRTIFRAVVMHKKGKKAFILVLVDKMEEDCGAAPCTAAKRSGRKYAFSELKGLAEASSPPPPPAKLSEESRKAQEMLDIMAHNGSSNHVPGGLTDYFIGDDPSCELVKQRILKAARQRPPVLILGERGTGKELVARAIHHYRMVNEARAAESGMPGLCPRRRGEAPGTRTFYDINCAAISTFLLEYELFGCEPNHPNPGNPERIGFREAAHRTRGTLFLDEIGQMPLDHQAKILRALSTGRIRRVGANEDIDVSDAHVIAATNKKLTGGTDEAKPSFLPDLYDRLTGTRPIVTPKLCSHPADIGKLATRICRRIAPDSASTLSREAFRALENHDWPGNIRELRNVLLTAYMLYVKDSGGSFATNVGKREIVACFDTPRNVPVDQQDTSEYSLPVDLLDTMEILAEASHETWRRKREAEGWVHGERRQETETVKTNPDLVDYDRLTEKQKSYAREEAKVVIKTLLAQGYTIHRKS